MSGGIQVFARNGFSTTLRAREADLSPGDIVLTGTPLGLYPVRGGDRVTVLVDDKIGSSCSVV